MWKRVEETKKQVVEGHLLSDMGLAHGDVVVCTEGGLDYKAGDEALIHRGELVVSKLPLRKGGEYYKKTLGQLNVSKFVKLDETLRRPRHTLAAMQCGCSGETSTEGKNMVKEEPQGKPLWQLGLKVGDVVRCVSENAYYFSKGDKVLVEADHNGELVVTTRKRDLRELQVKLGLVSLSKFVKEETMTNTPTYLHNNTLPLGLMSKDDKQRLIAIHREKGDSLRYNSMGCWEKAATITDQGRVFRPLPEAKVVNHKYYVNNQTGLMTKSKPAAPTTEITIQITIDGIGNLNTKVL